MSNWNPISSSLSAMCVDSDYCYWLWICIPWNVPCLEVILVHTVVIQILLIITCLLLPVKLLVSQEDYILGTQGAATSYESAMWFMFVDTFLEL